MFGSTLLLFGSLLLSPASATTPELRGPQWQGRAGTPSAVRTADVGSVAEVVADVALDLRDPFPAGRIGVVDGRRVVDATGLREPFEGRVGFAVVRAQASESGELRPLAPATRTRAPAVTPAPASAATVDPFVPRTSAPGTGAARPSGDGSGLRRPFGAS
jgi:hypothetical protein